MEKDIKDLKIEDELKMDKVEFDRLHKEQMKLLEKEIKDEFEERKQQDRKIRIENEKNSLHRKFLKEKDGNELNKHIDNNIMMAYMTGGMSAIIPLLKDFYKLVEASVYYHNDLKLLEEKSLNQDRMTKLAELKNDEQLLKKTVENVLKLDLLKNDGRLIDKVEKLLNGENVDDELVKFVSADENIASEFVKMKKIDKLVKNMFDNVNNKLDNFNNDLDLKLKNITAINNKIVNTNEKKVVNSEEFNSIKQNTKHNQQKMKMRKTR